MTKATTKQIVVALARMWIGVSPFAPTEGYLMPGNVNLLMEMRRKLAVGFFGDTGGRDEAMIGEYTKEQGSPGQSGGFIETVGRHRKLQTNRNKQNQQAALSDSQIQTPVLPVVSDSTEILMTFDWSLM